MKGNILLKNKSYPLKIKIQIQANYFVQINAEERHRSIADRRLHMFFTTNFPNFPIWEKFPLIFKNRLIIIFQKPPNIIKYFEIFL